ncbi:O-methyltransferase [Mycetocola reblochoni]|uniref:O-methyltransferase n=2 Tax=Mycetocola reblochoni TaxID=331618 RepID=A0A1R4J8A6_9MICO|nr:O-methyltransferase [Mycetocola reblochoni]RLP70115.1 O-methyltransferase [Mycetocola reblochoni]SJN28350.1 O-methyltransferase [Mycetocola reblochoni REB411]
MSEHDANWRYINDVVDESEVYRNARQHALELGIEAVSPSLGAQISVLAAAGQARSVVEIGTGTGVSGLYLTAVSERSVLTSIDNEPEHLQLARQTFVSAGIAASRTRLINGRALEVLPRMNDDSYDLVLVDADPEHVIEYVEHGLRLIRPGGLVLVPHVLRHGRVADPAQRDELTVQYRVLVEEIAASDAVIGALSPAGDGLLQISTRAD